MPRKIYKASPLLWMITIIFFLGAAIMLTWLIIVGVLSFIFPFTLEVLLGLICVLLASSFLVYVALLFSDLPSTSIELSDEGVTLAGLGYIVYTPWDNIENVAWKKVAFPAFLQLKTPAVVGEISLEEGKRQRRAVTVKRRWWMFTATLKGEAQYTHFIRLPILLLRARDQRDTTMDQYLTYYLPEMMSTRAKIRKTGFLS